MLQRPSGASDVPESRQANVQFNSIVLYVGVSTALMKEEEKNSSQMPTRTAPKPVPWLPVPGT